jgi:beta-lactam-binding protein with PASTA domain
MTEEEARQRLAALGLQMTVQQVVDSSVQSGQVSTQSPALGTQIDRGSTVIIGVVRQGAASPTAIPPTATVRPAASPTPSPRPTAAGQTPPGQQGR